MATQTHPQDDAGLHGSKLSAQGLKPTGEVHWNLVAPALIQTAIRRGEGELADMGPFVGVTTPHTAAELSRPTAILVGAEDAGLPESWRAIADLEVEIPMRGTSTDSLNASAAAAVLLFEAVRQRSASP